MTLGKFHAALTAGVFLAVSATAQDAGDTTAPETGAEAASAEGAAAPTISAFSITPAPDPLSSAAAVYATYQSDVSDIEQHKFENVEGIQEALTDLGSQNAEQLSRGWIAYSALVASQSPEFRAAVRDVDDRLHGLISDATENRQLSSIILMLRRQTQIFDLRSMPERFQDTAAEHLDILRCIRSGDAEAA